MNLFRTTAAVLAFSTVLLTLPVKAEEMEQGGSATTMDNHQNVSGSTIYTADAPNGFVMMGDLLIARPLLIAATIIGSAAFIVSYPFSLMGGNVGESAQSLIGDPMREAFVRCLGCDSSNSNFQK
ncbi:hypothetical protein SAMN05216296_2981 [Pseudomonas pohangensis]|jgi:hypothetical protein|uniref:Multidrug transporter n=1 Tax=Pseudomonas pohangensis TaxID=364197 RepID=A0A1H2HG28_9PSED|nr:multidrug transporter [Pseudomonas pohangensis]SDU30783.1 hypothetical protein SAMN05216296_2981 [Pseudomonas pohangensis]